VGLCEGEICEVGVGLCGAMLYVLCNGVVFAGLEESRLRLRGGLERTLSLVTARGDP
jgi:hypothetical protein